MCLIAVALLEAALSSNVGYSGATLPEGISSASASVGMCVCMRLFSVANTVARCFLLLQPSPFTPLDCPGPPGESLFRSVGAGQDNAEFKHQQRQRRKQLFDDAREACAADLLWEAKQACIEANPKTGLQGSCVAEVGRQGCKL
ncbi:unnamed protein product [Prorocentrum cordatum]|uniref:Uncharacterized protein n=1 Tax=Prorocentrum cordatum TaxID=2364126 RepID=A0ABN9VR41_9DINO|nr:unnamed protein product [Polarella glacialis]